MTTPTHLIMVLNRETGDLKLVSAHLAGEAQSAFDNLSSLFATTPNDVFKVTVPSDCGFVTGEVVTSQGTGATLKKILTPSTFVEAYEETQKVLAQKSVNPPRNGITRNDRGEYVQKLADGSEIISENDFSD